MHTIRNLSKRSKIIKYFVENIMTTNMNRQIDLIKSMLSTWFCFVFMNCKILFNKMGVIHASMFPIL